MGKGNIHIWWSHWSVTRNTTLLNITLIHKYSEVEIKKMLEFLIDHIYDVVGGQVFQQSVGIPMGTNCTPLLADMFLYSYEAEFIQKLQNEKKKYLVVAFIWTFRYIDDVLPINNNQFYSYVDSIIWNELEIKDSPQSVLHLLSI